MLAIVNLSRFFGWAALHLVTGGPQPEGAFHTSWSGERSGVSERYRKVYRGGQIVGWTLTIALVVALIALVVWLIA